MAAGPSHRVGPLLAARSTRAGAPAGPGEALAVQPDLVLLDGPGAAALLPHAGRPASEREERASRWAVVAGAPQEPAAVEAVRAFCREHGFAVGMQPARAGLPATVALEAGLIRADALVLTTRRDVGALGGLGCVVVRAGEENLAAVLAGEPMTLTVPLGAGVAVEGRLPRWAGAVDLAVLLRDQTADLRGQVLELSGETMTALDPPARLALCGALADLGVAALVPPDRKTRIWLRARQGGGRQPVPARIDAPPPDLRVEAAAVRPMASSAEQPGRFADPDRGPEQPLGEAVLVGAEEDLAEAVELLHDRNVPPDLHLIWVPASRRSLLHALESGRGLELLRAGATIRPPGSWPGPPASGRLRLATAAGVPGAGLASPAVVAASAVLGHLASPQRMRRSTRRATRAG